MNTKTITYLDDLNQTFYNQVAEPFSLSRSEAWEGWKQLLQFLRKLPSNACVLDLGCGNGRFATFLKANLNTQNWEYVGVDSNSTLLEIAQKEMRAGNSFKKVDFLQKDLIRNLMIDKLILGSSPRMTGTSQNWVERSEDNYNLVVALAILHHIPSFEMRQKFLGLMEKSVKVNGLIIVSTWEFIKIKSLMQRSISVKEFSANQINVNKSELEENDFFLTWERESSAIRYCHYIDQNEMSQLLEKTELEVVAQYTADGISHNLNQYYVLRRLKQKQQDR